MRLLEQHSKKGKHKGITKGCVNVVTKGTVINISEYYAATQHY